MPAAMVGRVPIRRTIRFVRAAIAAAAISSATAKIDMNPSLAPSPSTRWSGMIGDSVKNDTCMTMQMNATR